MLKYSSMGAFALWAFILVLLYFRDSLLGAGPVSITVQIIAILNMVWARLTFGGRSFHPAANPTEGGLVTTGPYRFVRHPIYASAIYFMWAGALSHISFFSISLSVAG